MVNSFRRKLLSFTKLEYNLRFDHLQECLCTSPPPCPCRFDCSISVLSYHPILWHSCFKQAPKGLEMALHGPLSAASEALVLLTDLVEPAAVAAARQGLQAFGSALCLQAAGTATPTGLGSAPVAALPRLVLGLCCLTCPAGAPKPVLQVRQRPAPFVLRDFCAAVGRLAASGEPGSNRRSGCGTTVAAALHQLVGVMAQDAACAAAGPRKTVLLLTDRTSYEPSDLFASFEVGSFCGCFATVSHVYFVGDYSITAGAAWRVHARRSWTVMLLACNLSYLEQAVAVLLSACCLACRLPHLAVLPQQGCAPGAGAAGNGGRAWQCSYGCVGGCMGSGRGGLPASVCDGGAGRWPAHLLGAGKHPASALRAPAGPCGQSAGALPRLLILGA